MKKIICITSIVILAMFSKTYAGDSLVATLNVASSYASQYIPVGSTSGVSNASKLVFNFRPTKGSVTITELRFSVLGPVSAIKVGTITAPVIGSTAYLTGLNIVVPAGSVGLNIDVYISYPPAGLSGIPSGAKSSIQSLYVKYVSISDNTSRTSTIPSMNFPVMTLVGSMPEIFVDEVLYKDALVLGAENKIADITVAANQLGDISIGKIRFMVGAQGFIHKPKFSNIKITNNNEVPIPDVQCTISDIDSTTSIIDCVFSPEYRIGAGTMQEFKLVATINGLSNVGTTMYVFTGLQRENFLWTDVEGNGLPSAENGISFFYFPNGLYRITGQGTFTGIKESANRSQTNVYPNPVTEYFIFNNAENVDTYTISLYDMGGHEVKKVHAKGVAKVNRGDLPAGTYVYKVCSDDGLIAKSGKIIIR